MKTEQDTAPSWLPDLFRQVEEELQKLTAGRHDQRPALERELEDIEASIKGWSTPVIHNTTFSVVDVVDWRR